MATQIIFPVDTENVSPRQFLSVALVETLVMAFVLVTGLHAPLTLIYQQWRLPFQGYLIVSPLLSIVTLGVTIWIQRSVFDQITHKDIWILGQLFILGIILASLSFVTNHPTPDDFQYIPNAVYFLDHPAAPMDFGIHSLIGAPGRPIISQSQATSLAYEYFRAVIAHDLGLNYLTVYFRSSAIMGFLLPLCYFILIIRFVSNSKQALHGTMMALSFLLVSIEGPRTYAIANLWNAYLGKITLLSIGIPLFAAFAISFLLKPSARDWLFLIACSMSLAGMTASTVSLLPILACILFGSYVITLAVGKELFKQMKNVLVKGSLYVASLSYVFLYGIFLYVQLGQGNTVGNPFDLGGANDFLGNLLYVVNPKIPFTPIVFVLSVMAMTVYTKKWQQIFLLAWIVLLFGIFLNPIAVPVITKAIVPPNIYWRMFFLLPFPALLGVVASTLPIGSVIQRIRFGMFGIAVVIYLMVTHQQGFLPIPVELPIPNLNIAREIIRYAPQGPMLAPEELAGPITIVSSNYPQLITRTVAMEYWLEPLGLDRDVQARIAANNFITGRSNNISDLEMSIEAHPEINSIVIRQNLSKMNIIVSLLNRYGYARILPAGSYLLISK